MSDGAISAKIRRKRCLNCDVMFSPQGKTPAQLGQWRKQRFCKATCRAEYHALMGGTKIRATVKKLVQVEVNRHLDVIAAQVRADLDAALASVMHGPGLVRTTTKVLSP